MKYLPIICKYLPANAMAIYPFIIFRTEQVRNSPIIVNHELIHFRQQLELLILPFYVLYLMNYMLNLMIFRHHHTAYRKILFEGEAYAKEADLQYLEQRKWFAWAKI